MVPGWEVCKIIKIIFCFLSIIEVADSRRPMPKFCYIFNRSSLKICCNQLCPTYSRICWALLILNMYLMYFMRVGLKQREPGLQDTAISTTKGITDRFVTVAIWEVNRNMKIIYFFLSILALADSRRPMPKGYVYFLVYF